MTLFEGLLLVNLVISVWVAYKLGIVETDIETIYQGLAMTMDKVGLGDNEPE